MSTFQQYLSTENQIKEKTVFDQLDNLNHNEYNFNAALTKFLSTYIQVVAEKTLFPYYNEHRIIIEPTVEGCPKQIYFDQELTRVYILFYF